MKKNIEIIRYSPKYNLGLTSDQVKERQTNKLDNKTKLVVGKSYSEIIFTNILSLFNITLFIIAGVMIAFKLYDSLFFLVVLLPNIGVGLYQDLKARALMGKLKVMTSPKVTVIRSGEEKVIKSDEVVLDDVLLLKSANQIPVDGVVLSGNVMANESLLTGESDNISKNIGDIVYSGSYVVSGQCYIRADKIGEESYASTLANKAKKFNRSSSEILKSLKGMFRIIGTIVFLMAAFMLITFILQQREIDKVLVGKITGSLVSMIPSGLYLLTSIALTLAVMSLAKKQAQVQDFYSVEMLARVNLLCVDKTGTITDGSMIVKKVIPTSMGDSEKTIGQIVSNMLEATGDENFTAIALKKYFVGKANKKCSESLPFNSDNKYSAATFDKGETYALGAFEVLPLTNKAEIQKEVENNSSKGYRVLILASGKGGIKDKKISGKFAALALIVLEDHIRDTAKATFGWFNDNNVGVKVISGDNALAVSEIAKNANINGADKYVSLAGKSLEETYALANEYNVFGRVNPEQKEMLVKAFKDMGKTVAMTGDGVNDILALKRADCSIALASGADAARNVSHIVLLDNNFDHLPQVVAEGRRVVNNLQRTSAIFLVKTVFAMVLTFIFTLASIITKDTSVAYPFTTNNMYTWEIIAIGYAAFFLALQPNKEIIKGRFLDNIFKKALPAAGMMIGSVLIVFLFHLLDKYGLAYYGLNDSEVTASLSCIVFSLLSIVVLYKISSPLDKYRTKVLLLIAFLVLALLGYGAYMTYTGNFNGSVIKIRYSDISKMGYAVGIFSLFVSGFLYLLIYDLVDLLKKGYSKDDKNK